MIGDSAGSSGESKQALQRPITSHKKSPDATLLLCASWEQRDKNGILNTFSTYETADCIDHEFGGKNARMDCLFRLTLPR